MPKILFDYDVDALMTTGASGLITDASRQMESLTGCTRSVSMLQRERHGDRYRAGVARTPPSLRHNYRRAGSQGIPVLCQGSDEEEHLMRHCLAVGLCYSFRPSHGA
jgi:hypothetical protein